MSLKKAKNFEWADKSTNAFVKLKHFISTAPILKPFSLSKRSTLTVDASGSSLGAVLEQNYHPVIYICTSHAP